MTIWQPFEVLAWRRLKAQRLTHAMHVDSLELGWRGGVALASGAGRVRFEKSVTYEVKSLQGTDFRKFHKKRCILFLSVVLTQIFIKI